jgi:protein gp37
MTDFTQWNPTVGCAPANAGCDNCPGELAAWQMIKRGNLKYSNRVKYEIAVTGDKKWTGDISVFPDRIEQPLHWRKPRRVLIGSMGDPFHPGVEEQWLDRMFAVMALCRQHTFMMLTKRPDSAYSYLSQDKFAMFHYHAIQWPSPNVHIGVLVHDQPSADELVPKLLEVPAAKRFVWVRLRGPVDLISKLQIGHLGAKGRVVSDISMVIVSGESGPNAHPLHPTWVRSLRNQCSVAGVSFRFEGWGEFVLKSQKGDFKCKADRDFGVLSPDGTWYQGHTGWNGRDIDHDTGEAYLIRVGPKRSGRLLDGLEHTGWPE